MPCQSDYMEPNEREKESVLVAKLLIYISESSNMIHESFLPALNNAAKDIYGYTDMLDRWTRLLCSKCQEIEEDPELANRIIYNGRNKQARDLAAWWERHQEADRIREAEENEHKIRMNIINVIGSALKGMKATKGGVSITEICVDGDNKSNSLTFKCDGVPVYISSENIKIS